MKYEEALAHDRVFFRHLHQPALQDAVQAAVKAIAIACSAQQTPLVNEFQARLDLYKAGSTCREANG